MIVRGNRKKKRRDSLTWGKILGVATGVHQNIGLKRGVKVVICTADGHERE